MSIRDSSFVNYLNLQCSNSLAFTIQSQCNCVISNKQVDEAFKRLLEEREKAFMNYFIKSGTKAKILIHPTTYNFPFNGLSEYNMKYKGIKPEELTKSYKKMKLYNEKTPRLQYNKERKGNKQ